MDFSPQQSEAVSKVGSWLKSGDQVFYLAGYAGTGKTTIAKHLAGLQNGDVLFGAYTGKAASVLNRKGCPASTIHSLVYRPVDADEKKIKDLQKQLGLPGVDEAKVKEALKKAVQPLFTLNEQSPLNNCDLIIIDEVSMVNEQIGQDLLSFGVKVLVLGDPGQLPPVEGAGYFTKREPDMVLTEIHRQAAGSPVINMATQVRKGRRLSLGHYGESRVISREATLQKDLMLADQVIVGRNKTRHTFNSMIRDWGNFTGATPQVGEKLICLRNNHEIGLLNGTQWDVVWAEDQGLHLELHLQPYDLPARPKPLICTAHHFDMDLSMMLSWERRRHNEFTWGYAITCHKSQGSQWPNVFIQDESWAFRTDSARWLYTAITRAEERVTIAI